MWNNNETSKPGGGFMDESYSVTGPSKDQQKKDSNHIVPMTIQQLYLDPPDMMIVGGKHVRMITVVAILRKIERVTTKIVYDLEDETGTISAIRWLENENQDMDAGIELNKYVRVFGSLREQAEKGRHLFILRILPVRKMAEVHSHFLEVVHTILRDEAGGLDSIMDQSKGDYNNSTRQVESSVNTSDGNAFVPGLTKEQTAIYKIIHAEKESEIGIERSAIKSRAPSNIVNQVDQILDFLASEGHIYTTCTDDHFKST